MDKKSIVDFFDSRADKWDDIQIIRAEKINKILDVAGIDGQSRVLDVACGTGVLEDFYLKRGARYVLGADISPKMVELAKDKFKEYSNIEFICADAENYSFENGFTNAVVFNAFPHFINPDRLIDNLCSCLVRGGTLTVAHDRGRQEIDGFHSIEAAKVSNGLMSEDDLARLFENSGFKEVYTLANEGIYIVSGTK